MPSGVFAPNRHRHRRIDAGFTALAQGMAMAIAILLLAIALTAGWWALPAMQTFGLGFLTSSIWDPTRNVYGVLPMVVGTLASSAIGLGLAIPVGLGTAIFLSEAFLPPLLQAALVFLVEMLAAIPSVVYGLWGIFVLIPLIRPIEQWLYDHFAWVPLFSTPPSGPGLLPAGLILAVMVLPIITAISRDSLSALPPDLRQAGFALGATRWEVLISILIPAAFSGIAGGVILALGRALGETMAVTLLIGNANRIPGSIFAPATTLSSLLANQFAESSGLQVSALMYAALILFALTLTVNIAAELIFQRVRRRYQGL
ncbi:MAG: phosphate ABC transporter permease subunit PstC [Elainellaceae cyanobacterium]